MCVCGTGLLGRVRSRPKYPAGSEATPCAEGLGFSGLEKGSGRVAKGGGLGLLTQPADTLGEKSYFGGIEFKVKSSLAFVVLIFRCFNSSDAFASFHV